MDELDKILKDKFSVLSNTEMGEDTEWNKMKGKVKTQNFLLFSFRSFNIYYALILSVLVTSGFYFILRPGGETVVKEKIKKETVRITVSDTLSDKAPKVPESPPVSDEKKPKLTVKPEKKGAAKETVISQNTEPAEKTREEPLTEVQTTSASTSKDSLVKEPQPVLVRPAKRVVFVNDTVFKQDTVRVRSKKRFERLQNRLK